MMIAALILALAQPDGLGRGWGYFLQAPALARTTTRVAVGDLTFDRATRRTTSYWMRHEFTRGGVTRTRWTDSKSCPAMIAVLKSMRDLPAPRIAPPGLSPDTEIIVDGTRYELVGPGEWRERVHMTSNVLTPLADWMERSLAMLEPCWRSTPPRQS